MKVYVVISAFNAEFSDDPGQGFPKLGLNFNAEVFVNRTHAEKFLQDQRYCGFLAFFKECETK